MADIVAEANVQSEAEKAPEVAQATFGEKIQMLKDLEAQMNKVKIERDKYVAELDAEANKTIEQLELKKKIKENAEYFTVDKIK